MCTLPVHCELFMAEIPTAFKQIIFKESFNFVPQRALVYNQT